MISCSILWTGLEQKCNTQIDRSHFWVFRLDWICSANQHSDELSVSMMRRWSSKSRAAGFNVDSFKAGLLQVNKLNLQQHIFSCKCAIETWPTSLTRCQWVLHTVVDVYIRQSRALPMLWIRRVVVFLKTGNITHVTWCYIPDRNTDRALVTVLVIYGIRRNPCGIETLQFQKIPYGLSTVCNNKDLS